jgi:hypothetical protein
MKDTINDIPYHDFMKAINKNLKEGNNEWVNETLKRFKIIDGKVRLKVNYLKGNGDDKKRNYEKNNISRLF